MSKETIHMQVTIELSVDPQEWVRMDDAQKVEKIQEAAGEGAVVAWVEDYIEILLR